ncbi:MAG: TIM barrel protein [Anaerolineae bacterium]
MTSTGGLRFGSAGVLPGAPKQGSAGGVAYVGELGLGAMEIEWVRARMRVISDETAKAIRRAAAKHDVSLSVHGAYYINLNSPRPQVIEQSREWVRLQARSAWAVGATDLVFHAAFMHDDSEDAVYGRVRRHLTELVQELCENGIDVMLRPETTGKPTAFGTLEQVLALADEIDGVEPCIDFAHIHARNNGGYNTYAGFRHVLDRTREVLGDAGLRNLHLHFSGIEYTAAGEQNHLLLDDSDMHWQELLQALVDVNAAGTLICECPMHGQEEELTRLQSTYRALKNEAA